MFTLQAMSFARKMTVIAIAILACLVLSAPAKASLITPLAPGSELSPVDSSDTFVTCCGSLVASAPAQTVVSADGQLTFTLNSAVYSDPNNLACPSCLDFVYQVTNSADSTESIARLDAIDYTSWTTYAGYLTNGGGLNGLFVDGDAAPVTIDRSAAGDIVGFGFFLNASVLPPGSTSKVLVIQTNATNFADGAVNVYGSNGVANFVDPFQPALTSSVPEPASLALLGIGLLAGIGILRFVRVRRGRQSV